MKWLKIKKYLKIFSVIICSIFIFSNKTYAYEFEFDGKSYNTDNFRNALNDYYPEYFENGQFDNYVELVWHKDNEIKFVLVPIKYRNIASGNQSLPNNFYKLDNNNFTPITDINYIIDKNNLSNIVLGAYQQYIGTVSGNRQIFVGDYTNNLWILELNIDKSNGNYRYYNTTIYSLSDNTLNNFNNYYIYCNYNLNFLFNAELDTSYIETPLLSSNPLEFRKQFNNDLSPNLKEITFDFPLSAINNGNTIKAMIEYGSNSKLPEEIPVFNNLKIVGYTLNKNEVDLTSIFNYGYDTKEYLDTKETTFIFGIEDISKIPADIVRIKVYFDFETFNNNYFFNVFDNYIDGTTSWNYIENFLVGYKKYTFPEGYDIAIIRSKSFKDLESFFISDKVYFTNTEFYFNLKLYDFINKKETYVFSSLTQYLINNVYLKIPIKIDETNNIFPVLTKTKNNESGVFYLKDDLFVQFVNSDNLDSIIENIPEDDFNNNNDLNIDSDIGNLNPPQQNEESLNVFFNQFWKMFEKFSDILSYITSCFAEFFYTLPTTIQFFLCLSFAFIIYKMLVFFIL